MFKKNIRPLDGALDKIMALKPKRYEMRTDEFKERLTLVEGSQYGLIAQEVETVLPTLVTQVKAPARLTEADRKAKTKKEGLAYKSVNYIELVPILVKAMQEQEAKIEALQAEVARLSAGR